MENELFKIQVSGIRDSEKSKSIGALVNLKFDEQGNCNSAMDLVWFPKSVCTLEEVEYNRDWFGKIITSKKYFIIAPKWFLEKNNINYKNNIIKEILKNQPQKIIIEQTFQKNEKQT